MKQFPRAWHIPTAKLNRPQRLMITIWLSKIYGLDTTIEWNFYGVIRGTGYKTDKIYAKHGVELTYEQWYDASNVMRDVSLLARENPINIGGVPLTIEQDSIGWYLKNTGKEKSDHIFGVLKIPNKATFVSKTVGYRDEFQMTEFTFPIVRELEDLHKVIIALMQRAEDLKLTTPPMKKPITLSAKNAKRIYDIACLGWKQRLFDCWGDRILSGQEIVVSDIFLKEMRKACINKEQKDLLDEIFGKVIVHPFPVNTRLFTKNGCKIGNAIVIGHEDNGNPLLKTDYGNEVHGYSNGDIRTHFWADFEVYSPRELARLKTHKYSVAI